MSVSLITTPNGKQHKAKENSWHLIHLNEKWKDSYACLNPEKYIRGNGKTRYRAKLPVLLSITSTDENEVIMDLPDVCRCFGVPGSATSYVDVQLFIDGREVPHPYSRGKSESSDQYILSQDSWYELVITRENMDDYEDLELREYQLDDGRSRYKAMLPMLFKSSGPVNKTEVDIDDVCKYFNVPSHCYESFEMFVKGKSVEHARNKVSESSHRLPYGDYFLGDPLFLDPGDFEKFIDQDRDRQFVHEKHKVLSITTFSDDSYPLYKYSDKWLKTNNTEMPRRISLISTETATVCLIPLSLLQRMGHTATRLESRGIILSLKPKPSGDAKRFFVVRILYKGGIPQCAEFLDYTLLIGDKRKFEDDFSDQDRDLSDLIALDMNEADPISQLIIEEVASFISYSGPEYLGPLSLYADYNEEDRRHLIWQLHLVFHSHLEEFIEYFRGYYATPDNQTHKANVETGLTSLELQEFLDRVDWGTVFRLCRRHCRPMVVAKHFKSLTGCEYESERVKYPVEEWTGTPRWPMDANGVYIASE